MSMKSVSYLVFDVNYLKSFKWGSDISSLHGLIAILKTDLLQIQMINMELPVSVLILFTLYEG